MNEIPPNEICVSYRIEQQYEGQDAEDGKVEFKKVGEDPPTLEKMVDADLAKFEEFFRGLGNEKLSGPERAAIKTYLWWKTHPEEAESKLRAASNPS